MMTLAAYQFTEFRRTRFWLAPVLGYLTYLVGFYLRIAQHSPGSYGRGVLGILVLGLGLAWTLCASQQPALWQITVVAAGSRERAQLSRVLLSVLLVLPLATLSVLVTAAGHLSERDPIPPLFGASLLYLLFGAVGCALGVAFGRKASVGLISPVLVGLGLMLLTVLLQA